MVQRKGPDIGARKLPPTKAQADKEKKKKPPLSSQDASSSNSKESAGASDLKRKLKKARSIKRLAELGELDAHLDLPLTEESSSEKPSEPMAKLEHSTPPPAKPINKPRTPPTKSSFFSSSASKQQQALAKASGTKAGDSAAPNYMKPTNSSDARKEQQRQVRFQPPPPPSPTPVITEKTRTPNGSTSSTPSSTKSSFFSSYKTTKPAPTPTAPLPRPPKLKKSDSIKKSAKMLSKKLSLKPIRSLMRKCSEAIMSTSSSKPTCSSTLKDSKFPKELELNPGGTELEGTSAIKVCPFTYCSLNGHHHHEPAPPLKRFLSMRRRSIKKQKSMKMRQLSVKRRGSVKGLKRAKSKKGGYSEASPAVEVTDGGEEDDFFIEIHDDPGRGDMDPNLYDESKSEDCSEADGKAKVQYAERTQVPSKMQGDQFDDSNNNTCMKIDDEYGDETGSQSTFQEFNRRQSFKLRQLSVRRRSWHKTLNRARSRRRASFDVSYAVELPQNHDDDDFYAQVYYDPRGIIVGPRLYDSSSNFEHSGSDSKAQFKRTETADIASEGQKGSIENQHQFEDNNTFGSNDDHGETSSQSAKGGQVPNEGQKGTEQKLVVARPVDDSFTELSLESQDDNFDMESATSISETEVIEKFLESIGCLDEENAPAEETNLPYVHKDRKRWDTQWCPDCNMVFAAGKSSDEQSSTLVSTANYTEWDGNTAEESVDDRKCRCSTDNIGKRATVSDDFDGSKCEDQSNASSTLIDPSCETDMGETLLEKRDEASFSMDDIYCKFNFADSENEISREINDTSDQKLEQLKQGIAEEDKNETVEESQHQIPVEKQECKEAEDIPVVAEGNVEKGYPENTDKGGSAEISCDEIQSSEGSLDSEKGDKDGEESEDSSTKTANQRKPREDDDYDMRARKEIEDAVQQVYIYNVLKGSEGPAIIQALADAIANPGQNQQGGQGKSSSRISITRKRAVEYLDKVRGFNPRAPNFLPIEPDPEAEKVDLRHQEMNGKKNAEEWMIDYALQRLLDKLASPQKKRVTLIVKAYEAVISAPSSDHSLQHDDKSFARTRPVQACS